MRSRAFWIGLVIGLLLACLAGFGYVVSGVSEMSATRSPGLLDRLGDIGWENSVNWRAPDGAVNPLEGDPAAVDAGLEHYRSMCMHCHGAPKVDAAGWARVMLPMPPDLDAEHTQARPDGELFHIIDHGVRMTGMPAFGGQHSDEEIWQMVSFIRELPRLSEERLSRLEEAGAGHHEGSGHGTEAAGAEEGHSESGEHADASDGDGA